MFISGTAISVEVADISIRSFIPISIDSIRKQLEIGIIGDMKRDGNFVYLNIYSGI